MLRVRAVKDFHEWDLIHKLIVEEVLVICTKPPISGTCSGGGGGCVGLSVSCSAASAQQTPPNPQSEIGRGLCNPLVKVGRRGLAHKYFPLSPSLLLDGAILTSEAFQSKGEKDLDYKGSPTLKNIPICVF